MPDRNFIKLPIEFARNKNWIYFSNSAQPIASNVFPFSIYEGFSLLKLAHLLCTTSKANNELWVDMFFFLMQIQRFQKKLQLNEFYSSALFNRWIIILENVKTRITWTKLVLTVTISCLAVWVYNIFISSWLSYIWNKETIVYVRVLTFRVAYALNFSFFSQV